MRIVPSFHTITHASLFTCFILMYSWMQEWSRELYKSMSGRPVYSTCDFQADGSDDAISAEFLLSCSPAGVAKAMNAAAGKVVPLNLQIMVAAGLVLVYHFLLSFLYPTL